MSGIDALLEKIRHFSRTEREKGTYFENLMILWLGTDPLQQQQYEGVERYADWARGQGLDQNDTGIDLVASLKEERGFVAIQCKFYQPDHVIQAHDLDSFLGASAKENFCGRLFIDTTEKDWGKNAEKRIQGLRAKVIRISLADLRNSPIDWEAVDVTAEQPDLRQGEKKHLRPYQQNALRGVCSGFEASDRGQLIMACGTGKTLVALRIAERVAGRGKRVLFLAPSLSLISQTMREWANDTETVLRSFAVCSDRTVMEQGKRKDPDAIEENIRDVAFPVTTDAKDLARSAKKEDPSRMTVVYSTYQSLDKIAAAQKEGLQDFDLIVCDEAHKTTSAVMSVNAGEEKVGSKFTDIHNKDYVKGNKRLYMTATPRIFGEQSRAQSRKEGGRLYDMGDQEIFGDVFSSYSFGEAVRDEMLTEYQVIVLQMDEDIVSGDMQRLLTDDERKLRVDDSTKIVGCYKALQDPTRWHCFGEDGARKNFQEGNQENPLQRVITFCRDIKSSKKFREEFDHKTREYKEVVQSSSSNGRTLSACEVRHVDGTNSAKERNEELHWLSEEVDRNECRILTNARCLTEGIDVPSLDAIIFLHARKSQVDIVQSVGRVMRKLKGKEFGYVVLPIVVPTGMKPSEVMEDNKTYDVVWQVLNALKSHDNRLKSSINNAAFSDNIFSKLRLFYVVSDRTKEKTKNPIDIGNKSGGDADDDIIVKQKMGQRELNLEATRAIRPLVVDRCGDRSYWKKWGEDIGAVAKKQVEKIRHAIHTDQDKKAEFDKFLEEIRDDLNNEITEDEAIDMLSQHLITEPVFKALFDKGEDFIRMNAVSKAMHEIVEKMYTDDLQRESQNTLREFYEDVRTRTVDLDSRKIFTEEERKNSMKVKQNLITQLYDDFFKSAFPTLSGKLGIVYTPVEAVDFIIHSVNDLLEKEFNTTLGSKGVHILDPFTGTGTFITRLLQSGLIKKTDLTYKYENEIHANEIVLLAYYIASINIETAYQGIVAGDYAPFKGICLTDTFAMQTKDDLIDDLMPDNSERRKRQKSLDIKVIFGNPPWRVGQKSEGDNTKNVEYEHLDKKIRNTYVAASNAKLNKSAYDSYIRAIRWASDRLGEEGGIVGFVTNNGWIDSKSSDGLRKCLEEECSSIYIVNLRGNIQTGMTEKYSSVEGGNIFNVKVGIAIAFLVKKTNPTKGGEVYYYDIGEEHGVLEIKNKLTFLQDAKSVNSLIDNNKFSKTQTDQYYDWINKRDSSFELHIEIANNEVEEKIFDNFTSGVVTARDTWCYNPSKIGLEKNIDRFIQEYNAELKRYQDSKTKESVESFIAKGSNNIPFTRALKKDFRAGKILSCTDGRFAICSYRPFFKQWIFFSPRLNEEIYQNFRFFPDAYSNNRTINMASKGHHKNQLSVYMVDTLSDFNGLYTNGIKCFPLKLYDKQNNEGDALFEGNKQQKDAITFYGLQHFQQYYGSQEINREDIFYYTYAVLHSHDYRRKYADNLNREKPRIPTLGKIEDFWAFSKAGKELGDMHVDYEQAPMYDVSFLKGSLNFEGNAESRQAYFRVEKMRFARGKDEADKGTIHYNDNIVIADIPLRAYDYAIIGNSAIEWVMNRQCVRKVKAMKSKGAESEIFTNDANDYAIETMNNPAYPLELLLRVITVSLKTLEIVDNLPDIKV